MVGARCRSRTTFERQFGQIPWVTQGETLEEARAMAADAIRLVLEDFIAEGRPIPPDTAGEPIREKVKVVVAAA